MVVFFSADDASVEDVDFFFEVDVAFVGAVVVAVSSFFWDWQPRNAVNVTAMIKDKTDVFIGLF